jgi:hypothetical protein
MRHSITPPRFTPLARVKGASRRRSLRLAVAAAPDEEQRRPPSALTGGGAALLPTPTGNGANKEWIRKLFHHPELLARIKGPSCVGPATSATMDLPGAPVQSRVEETQGRPIQGETNG